MNEILIAITLFISAGEDAEACNYYMSVMGHDAFEMAACERMDKNVDRVPEWLDTITPHLEDYPEYWDDIEEALDHQSEYTTRYLYLHGEM